MRAKEQRRVLARSSCHDVVLQRAVVSEGSLPPSSDSLERKLQKLAPSGGDGRAFLLVLDGPRAGRLHLLGDDDTLIGRNDAADISLADGAVSHDHARVVRRADGYHLIDLNSRNGTLLNGVLIAERKLRKRDRIQIGETALVFLEEGPAESTVTISVPRQEFGTTSAMQVRQASQVAFPSGPAGGYPNLAESAPEEDPAVALLRKIFTILRFLRRHLWVMLPLPLLGLAAGAYSIKVRPPPETASAAVKLTQTQQRNPVGYVAPVVPGMPGSEAFFQEPEKNFANPELVNATLSGLSVEPNRELTQAVFSGLKIERDFTGPTGVYVAQFAHSPDSSGLFPATGFLDAYLENYLGHEVDKSIRVLTSEASFMEKKLADVRSELVELDNALAEFRREHIDSLPEQAASAMVRKLDLTQRKGEYEIEVQKYRIQAENVRAQLKETATVVTRRAEEIKPLERDLDKKKRELAQLRGKGLTDDHPDVSGLLREIATLDQDIKRRMSARVSDLERTIDPHRQELQRLLQQHMGNLRVAESALGNVSQQLAAVAGSVQEAPEVDAKIQQLSGERASLQSLRDELFEKHRQKLVQIDLETANVRARYEIVSKAEAVDPMTNKFLLKRLAGGLLVGLILALAIAIVVDLRRFIKQNPELLKA